jgi:ABC-type Fe3+/spermidine/putrescine transport system ATPase subunit
MFLELDAVEKHFGEVAAVSGVSLGIPKGQVLSLLGPSGCGKTTTLRMIAGFESPTAGAIRLGGRDITAVPARRRNIGMVFQSYALFPHLTAEANVAFGLDMRRISSAENARRVRRALDVVRMGDLGDRQPRQLSGGQQQRVALARALVIEPDLLLLDEPLSALDLKLREEMRDEIHRIVRELAITTVFVTHDQGEALVLSDAVAVMNKGRVEQFGVPKEVYDRPRTAFVADFIGGANVLSGHWIAARFVTECGLAFSDFTAQNGAVAVALRPEDVVLSTEGEGVSARVERARFLGAQVEYTLLTEAGIRLTARCPAKQTFAEGAALKLSAATGAGVILEGGA